MVHYMLKNQFPPVFLYLALLDKEYNMDSNYIDI
jgi:hypothetical protein